MHAPKDLDDIVGSLPLCGQKNSGIEEYYDGEVAMTEERITCKKCLKMLAKQGWVPKRPPMPSKWRNPNDKHATRVVTDKTLGGDVVYMWIYAPRQWSQQKCTLEEWNEYQKGAKRL